MTAESAPDAARRAELRVREGIHPATEEPIAETRNRLDELAATGHLDAAETVVWGKRLPLDPGDATLESMVRTYQRFRAWATRTGVDLEPGFRVHEVTSLATDASHAVVTVPLVCLAVYQGGDVVEVYPHSNGDGPVAVEQGLERLANVAGDGRRGNAEADDVDAVADDGETNDADTSDPSTAAPITRRS